MDSSRRQLAADSRYSRSSPAAAGRSRLGLWALWVVALTLAFIQPLMGLMRHAIGSELHSYIPLVPFVAGYLLYLQRAKLPTTYRTSMAGAIVLAGIAVAGLAASWVWRGSLSVNDGLAVLTLAYLSLVAAGGFLFVGSEWMTSAAFPIGFLIFLVPLPDAVVTGLERASVLGSADVSAFLLRMTGTPIVRDGEVFMLPGIVVKVAQECSGIRSSWVLFITSIVAAHLFLESPWRRIVLVAFVIPLAIVRNGFRILVIGLLCVHIGPHMIDSVIHHQGGPLFFALSLIPLFLLLWWLRRPLGTK
jgi:exosortase C (VPDSG-CTERM-specific)